MSYCAEIGNALSSRVKRFFDYETPSKPGNSGCEQSTRVWGLPSLSHRSHSVSVHLPVGCSCPPVKGQRTYRCSHISPRVFVFVEVIWKTKFEANTNVLLIVLLVDCSRDHPLHQCKSCNSCHRIVVKNLLDSGNVLQRKDFSPHMLCEGSASYRAPFLNSIELHWWIVAIIRAKEEPVEVVFWWIDCTSVFKNSSILAPFLLSSLYPSVFEMML